MEKVSYINKCNGQQCRTGAVVPAALSGKSFCRIACLDILLLIHGTNNHTNWIMQRNNDAITRLLEAEEDGKARIAEARTQGALQVKQARDQAMLEVQQFEAERSSEISR